MLYKTNYGTINNAFWQAVNASKDLGHGTRKIDNLNLKTISLLFSLILTATATAERSNSSHKKIGARKVLSSNPARDIFFLGIGCKLS